MRELTDLMALHDEAAGLVDINLVPHGDIDIKRRAASGDRQALAQTAALRKLLGRIQNPHLEPPNCTICHSVFDQPPALFAVIAAHERPNTHIARGICRECVEAFGGDATRWMDIILAALAPTIGAEARAIEVNPASGTA